MILKNKPSIGELTESFFMTLRIFSFASTIAIVIVLYANIQPFLLRFTPWMTLWWFIGILATIGLTGMGLVHRFLMPAIRAHQRKQASLADIERKIDELTELVRGRKDE